MTAAAKGWTPGTPRKAPGTPRGAPSTAGLLLGVVAAAALLLVASSRPGGGGLLSLQRTADCMAAGPTNTASGAAAAAMSIGQQQQQPQQPGLVEALQGCEDFECLRAAHAQPRGSARFNFPHFFIIGYPKCSTTSLHAYLEMHPQVVGSSPKEPHFFNKHGGCWRPNGTATWGCDAAATRSYLLDALHRDAVVESGLSIASFEATVEYAYPNAEVMAAGIRREVPWVKIVVNIREPISLAISGLYHMLELLQQDPRPDWFAPPPALAATVQCLERLGRGGATMHECLAHWMRTKPEGLEFDFAPPTAIWLHAFPREQVHVIQMENLTSPDGNAAVLGDLYRFLRLDPWAPTDAGSAFPTTNSRKGQHPGWPMKRAEYESLVAKARPQAHMLATLLEEHGYVAAQQWLAPWEAAWQRNLDSCDEKGDCMVQVT